MAVCPDERFNFPAFLAAIEKSKRCKQESVGLTEK